MKRKRDKRINVKVSPSTHAKLRQLGARMPRYHRANFANKNGQEQPTAAEPTINIAKLMDDIVTANIEEGTLFSELIKEAHQAQQHSGGKLVTSITLNFIV